VSHCFLYYMTKLLILKYYYYYYYCYNYYTITGCYYYNYCMFLQISPCGALGSGLASVLTITGESYISYGISHKLWVFFLVVEHNMYIACLLALLVW